MQEITVSRHAVERYRQRRKETDLADKLIQNRIKGMLKKGRKMEPVNKVAALLHHRMQEAEYYQYGDLVAVLVDKTIVTVSKNLKGRWVEKESR